MLAVGACTGDDPSRNPKSQVKPADSAPIANAGITHPDPMAGSRPNILFITADDMAPRDLRWMPQLRRLMADQGVEHTNAITPTPICAPSRASWMSGQYAQNHGVQSVEGEKAGSKAFDERHRLPTWLQAAGYQTGFLGKYLNGNGLDDPTYVPPGWSDWRGSVDMTTYDFSRVRLNVNGKLWKKEGYQTPILAEQTNRMIDRFATKKDPWFLNINYVAPHHGGPIEADDPSPAYEIGGRFKAQTPGVEPKYRDSMKDVQIPQQPDQFKQPENTRHEKLMNAKDRAVVTEIFQQRLESLKSVDDAIASHFAELKRVGQLENTVVVFMSDNGMSMGEHNRIGKLAPYYEALQVPLLVRGPGLPQGTVDNTLVTNADLAVTFAALAGATPTTSVDGIDVAPLWTGSTIRTRTVPIAAWAVRNGKKRLWSGVRVDDAWTFARGRGLQQLYDLTQDPYETVNVARRPDLVTRTVELAKLSRTLQKCAGVSCQVVEWDTDTPTRPTSPTRPTAHQPPTDLGPAPRSTTSHAPPSAG